MCMTRLATAWAASPQPPSSPATDQTDQPFDIISVPNFSTAALETPHLLRLGTGIAFSLGCGVTASLLPYLYIAVLNQFTCFKIGVSESMVCKQGCFDNAWNFFFYLAAKGSPNKGDNVDNNLTYKKLYSSRLVMYSWHIDRSVYFRYVKIIFIIPLCWFRSGSP